MFKIIPKYISNVVIIIENLGKGTDNEQNHPKTSGGHQNIVGILYFTFLVDYRQTVWTKFLTKKKYQELLENFEN